jgi:sec-independent protein translocase protein TatA
MFAPSPVHLIILLVVVLLVFGSKRLPEVSRSLGQSMRDFKGAVTGRDEDLDVATVDETLSTPPVTGPEAADEALSHLPLPEAVAARQSTPAPTPEIALAEEAERLSRRA